MTRSTRRLAALALPVAGACAVAWGPPRAGLADDRRPAVRVGAARPMDAQTETARGVPSIPPPFDPLNAPTPEPPKATPPAGGMFQGGKPTPLFGGPAKPPAPQQQPVSAQTQPPPNRGVTGWVTDRATAVKNMFVKPPATPPQPRVGQPPQPQQPAAYPQFPVAAKQPAPQRTMPNGAPGYAGNPAYRWYGWGTTTPGANPFAPAGEYPRGSAGWYAASGATPGAFPVPVTNAFRPPPGGDPPAYLATAAPAPTPPPAFAPQPPIGPRPIAESDRRAVAAPKAAEPQWQPIAGPASVPTSTPSLFAPTPPAADPKWKPAAVPVTRGQQPDEAADPTDLIRTACHGLATNVRVAAGPTGLVVAFDAPNAAVAEAAARAVSAVPQLRDVAVEFRANVGR